MVDAPHSILRAQMEEERDRLRSQLEDLHATDGSFDEGFADTSQVTAERGEIEALTGSLAETLRDIEDALAKFESGTYGQCESCGTEISAARLEAMPAARLCINCASQRR
ncbi:MAG: TraR/DksA C4-type zinc finger protein [Acidimicrobiia bacterium]|jgi:RNA polymerase-binding transcription factor DksA